MSENSSRCTRVDDLVPEDARFHDVALLGGRHLAPPLAGEVEGDAGDALDLVRRVDLRVDGALLAGFERDDLLRLAEIDAARELAHDDDVEPLDDLALERRGVGEGRVADRRPEIGEQAEILAQAQEPGLRALVVGHRVPFRSADGAEQDGVRRLRALHGCVGDGDAMRVIRGPADQVGLRLEAGDAALAEPADELLHLADHFRADAVAGQEEELMGSHGSPVFLCHGRV